MLKVTCPFGFFLFHNIPILLKKYKIYVPFDPMHTTELIRRPIIFNLHFVTVIYLVKQNQNRIAFTHVAARA